MKCENGGMHYINIKKSQTPDPFLGEPIPDYTLSEFRLPVSPTPASSTKVSPTIPCVSRIHHTLIIAKTHL